MLLVYANSAKWSRIQQSCFAEIEIAGHECHNHVACGSSLSSRGVTFWRLTWLKAVISWTWTYSWRLRAPIPPAHPAVVTFFPQSAHAVIFGYSSGGCTDASVVRLFPFLCVETIFCAGPIRTMLSAANLLKSCVGAQSTYLGEYCDLRGGSFHKDGFKEFFHQLQIHSSVSLSTVLVRNLPGSLMLL